MIKRVFLDTNIILDLLDSKRVNHQNAKDLLTETIEQNIEVFISEDMLSTIFYIIKDKKVVLDFFEVIYEEWNIVSFGKSVIKEAIYLCKQNPNQDLEDTMQCLCAKENSCDIFITSDKKFIECGIKIVGYGENLIYKKYLKRQSFD